MAQNKCYCLYMILMGQFVLQRCFSNEIESVDSFAWYLGADLKLLYF